MREYSTFTWFGCELPFSERAALIKEAGFTTVMLWWSDDLQMPGVKKEDHPDILRKLGLRIENIHLPIRPTNGIWSDTLDGNDAFTLYKSCIDDCKRYEIPVAVMHPTQGSAPPPINQLGLDRLKHLADTAAESGNILALENLSQWHYLEPIFSSIDSPGLGFCYDSGHDFLYCENPYELPVKYAAKLAALHLHDNMKDRDDHMLPAEGIIDINEMVSAIAESGYNGPLSLEVANPRAGEKPLDYLKRALDISIKLENLRQNKY